jgi:predicted PurR-regulated permease PerM
MVNVGRTENTINAIWRLLLRLALIAGIIYAGYRLRAIIATIIIAVVIAYVLDPMVEWLTRQKWFILIHEACAQLVVRFQTLWRRPPRHVLPRETRVQIKQHAVRTYATLYVFIAFFVVVWQTTKAVTRPFADQVRHFSSKEGKKELQATWQVNVKSYDAQVPEFAQSKKIEKLIEDSDIGKQVQTAIAGIGPKALSMATHIVEAVILPVLAFYFLIDGHKLKKEFVGLVPRPKLREALWILNEFNGIMRSYVIGQFILCLLAGVVVGGGLWALGVPYPLVMGLLAGITRGIPIVGPIIGGIPIILLTFATKGSTVALAVLGFFTFLHFAESKFIMPLLIGDRMELHPVVIIVVLIVGGEAGAVLIGGAIGALLGMFFAAPIASIIRVLVRRYWLNIKETHNRKPPRTETLPVSQTVNAVPTPAE